MKLRILVVVVTLFGSTLFTSVRAQSDINLTGYTQTFDDEFNSLSVTATSPKRASTWYAYPPYGSAGDYSDSQWDLSSFSVSSGILTDKAWLDSGKWHSGNLSSVDPTAAGFSQLYGYFEIRAQMPNSGTGAWPAFWLDSTSGISGKQNEEVDIFEWYGVCDETGKDQAVIQEASHNWSASGAEGAGGLYSPGTKMPGGQYPWQGYHIYGCQIDPVHLTWYIDGVQTNQVATPTSYMTTPFYMMVDYALGGGWSLTGMVNNSSLSVDWVRVYALPPASSGGSTAPTDGIGVQFKGEGTALSSTDSAGASEVAQTHWNVLSGASFAGYGLADSTGTGTTATLTGSAKGTYWSGGYPAQPAGNSKLASGELFNGTASSSPTLTVSHLPYARYDVYAYAAIDAANRAETISVTPAGGSAQSYSFLTESDNSSWTAATSTWNGSGTPPKLPDANYVHFSGLTASSFTMAWGAPGNGGLNGFQIVPVTAGTGAPAITQQPADQTIAAGEVATFTVAVTGSATLTYQWEKDGANISGATGASYTTPAATSASNGTSYSVVVTNAQGSVTSSAAILAVSSSAASAGIGIQFKGNREGLSSSELAGVPAVAQSHWNVLAGASFRNEALLDNLGASSTATLTGSASGTYWGGGSHDASGGNQTLAAGELVNEWPDSPALTVANLPFAKYDVYVYASLDASGRAETVSVTPAGGATKSYSFATQADLSTWVIATSTWNGSGSRPTLSTANCAHFSGLTGDSFKMTFGAPGNGGINGIQIVPSP